jgi:hypothetical protein
MIKLTRLDGIKIEVDPAAITLIEPAVAGEWAPGAKSKIRVDGLDRAVRETVEEIDALRATK